MELSVINIKGEDTGKKITLSEEIFGIAPNEHAVYLDVKQYLANQRQGTHKSKERAEVNYSTRKLKRQKGTGGARAGSRKSPVFTPRTKSYLEFLNAISMTGKKTLLILGAADKNVYLSGRNIPKTQITTADMVNTYELMHADRLLISAPALDVLETLLNK